MGFWVLWYGIAGGALVQMVTPSLAARLPWRSRERAIAQVL
jgi:hypothetical protein